MRILLILLLCWGGLAQAASPEAVYGTHGMVVSRSRLASEAGIEIMKEGGNAIDGAVATAFALAVTYPSAGNLAGGGFDVVRLKDGTVITLDNREKAPAAATRNMYLDKNGNIIKGMSRNTRAATGVPGTVDGLLTLLKKYGSMTREQVMAPAIRLAMDGFPLDEDLVREFNRVVPSMHNYPGSMRKFTRNGKPYQVGDIWKQPLLARTLMAIQSYGRDGFYKGRVARLIVAEMKRGNGLITMQDLADYKSVWRQPIKSTYRGYTIYGMPPPSSGGILVAMMLNMLEPYNLHKMGWGSSAAIHLMVEAERRAYADRATYLGDSDFYPVPVKKLISKKYARMRFRNFKPHRASYSKNIKAGRWPGEDLETTQLSVMDGQGNAVSMTTTLNSGFGNRIVVQGGGFLLNNEMDDFSAKENTANQYGLIGHKANDIQPNKRMLSSMSPTIVTKDGKLFLVTGSPGGSTIITTVLQVIVNVIDFDMDIEDAVSLPRFHNQWEPDMIMYGPYAISPDTMANLKKMGYKRFFKFRFGRGIGDANSILLKDGVMEGMKDPRNAGAAVGY